MVRKRLVSVLLAGALVAGMGLQVNVTVKADDLQDAKNKASEQQSQIDAAQAAESRSFLDKLFHGSVASFATALCDSGVTKEELEELRRLLEKGEL